MKVGAVGVPLSPLLNAHSIDLLARNANCTAVVFDRGIQLPDGLHSKRICSAELESAMDDLRSAAPEPQIRVSGKQLAHIMFSSGTTGAPKGISISQHVRFSYGWVNATLQRMNDSSVVLHSGSLVFNGAMVTLMPHLFTGCHYVLMPSFDSKEVCSFPDFRSVFSNPRSSTHKMSLATR